MPALDTGAPFLTTHIIDGNKANPTKTLCGRSLDRSHYWTNVDNFHRVDCKTCHKVYYGVEHGPERNTTPVVSPDDRDDSTES